MRYLEVEIPEETGYLVPIGDLHLGDPSFEKKGREKLIGYLEWVKDNPNARIFLMGDILDVAGIGEKTTTTGHSVDENGNIDEYFKAVNIFTPYKDQIIGIIDGNHEARILTSNGLSLAQFLAANLGIQYCKWSAVVRFKIKKRTDKGAEGRWGENYNVYLHHTTGGGNTIGGKMNRVEKLRPLVDNMDVYCGGHNHMLGSASVIGNYPSYQEKAIKERTIWYVDCGGYLSWNNSYAEQKMMSPVKLGSPRIRFDGNKHDVHVSI